MPDLQAMQIRGAAEVWIADLAGEQFRFELSGAAKLEMHGMVDDLDIQVSGAGNINARDLKARHAKVRISGAGSADLTATESLDAKVSGSGSIKFWGDPETKKTSISGLGSISAG